jgi:hypothetical protein
MRFGASMREIVKTGLLPTPNARDYLGSTKPGKRITSTGKIQNYGEVLPDTIKRMTGTNSQLNPRFVAEMMGFPANWTELPFLNGDQKVSKPTEMP